jgi:uncharacterized tellurite resistance protein B-like protein
MDPENLSPLEILGVSLAYAAMADGEVNVQERAAMVAALSKLVRMGIMNDEQLKAFSAGAFKVVNDKPLASMVPILRGRLTKVQALNVLANVTDMVLADGKVDADEIRVVETLRDAFGVDADDIAHMRHLLLVKNDARVFTNPDHAWNTQSFSLTRQDG